MYHPIHKSLKKWKKFIRFKTKEKKEKETDTSVVRAILPVVIYVRFFTDLSFVYSLPFPSKEWCWASQNSPRIEWRGAHCPLQTSGGDTLYLGCIDKQFRASSLVLFATETSGVELGHYSWISERVMLRSRGLSSELVNVNVKMWRKAEVKPVEKKSETN